MTDRDAARHARQQRHWPVRVRRLDADSSDDLTDAMTAEERIALVWILSARMWELTGRPLPSYSRAETPVAVVRGR